MDLPAWVVQRLWMALVLCVAFVGMALLARALGVRSDLACIVAGFAFALSPRMLTVLGPSSIEVWPSALAPWVLLPLVIGSRRGSPVRAAALAALAVAMVGGVNAAATSAVLPLGVLWLLTREPGPRRRSMMLWWPLFTVLGTLWWLVPLFLLGAYSPPFLDFIETAAVTTYPDDAGRRAAGHLQLGGVPRPGLRAPDATSSPRSTCPSTARSSWRPVSAGLALRRNPHRLFLLSGRVRGPRARDDGPPRRRAGVVRLAAAHAARRVARPAAQRAQVRRRAPAPAGRRPCLRSRRAPVPLERRPTNPTGPRRVRTDQS